MQLFLVRHADAILGAETDHQRPLSELGKLQASQSADFLSQSILSPETIILCSDALRTTITAKIIVDKLNPVTRLMTNNSYYHASVGQWCDGINEYQCVDNLILVGHNPTISYLSKHLNSGHAQQFSPSCVAHFELEIQPDGLKLPAQFIAFFKPDAV